MNISVLKYIWAETQRAILANELFKTKNETIIVSNSNCLG